MHLSPILLTCWFTLVIIHNINDMLHVLIFICRIAGYFRGVPIFVSFVVNRQVTKFSTHMCCTKSSRLGAKSTFTIALYSTCVPLILPWIHRVLCHKPPFMLWLKKAETILNEKARPVPLHYHGGMVVLLQYWPPICLYRLVASHARLNAEALQLSCKIDPRVLSQSSYYVIAYS